MTLLLFLGGLIALLAGAEFLVRGASRLARAWGLSPLLVGLTVVSLGTSSPEIAVSVMGALKGSSDLVVGNVVGSNACNVLLILGASALITPLIVAQQLVRVDVPILVGASLLVYLLAWDGVLSTLDGTILGASGVAYVVFLVLASRKTKPEVEAEYAKEFGARSKRSLTGIAANAAFVLGGLGLLVLGSRALVTSASEFARALGVSELVIALTVVATGTSLPELATSVLAAFRGERDIAVGNVVGSNLFNLLFVLGAAGLAAPEGVLVSSAMLRFDLPVMVAASVACLPIFFTGFEISRWEGGVLLGYYLAFTAYVVLRATEHDALPAFSGAMLVFVIPLTALTLGVICWRHFRPRPMSS